MSDRKPSEIIQSLTSDLLAVFKSYRDPERDQGPPRMEPEYRIERTIHHFLLDNGLSIQPQKSK